MRWMPRLRSWSRDPESSPRPLPRSRVFGCGSNLRRIRGESARWSAEGGEFAFPIFVRSEGDRHRIVCGDEGKVVLYSRAAAGAGSLSVGEEDDLFLRNQAEA